jgi:hypothetical protein
MLTLRTTTSTGAVVDDPGPDELAGLLAEVSRGGAGAFLIVENRRRRTSLQVMAVRGGFAVESSGGARAGQRAAATDLGVVTAVALDWAAGARDWWRALSWAPLGPMWWDRLVPARYEVA